MKNAKQYLEEANAIVPRISPADGIAKHDAGASLFIDVRDSGDIAKSGTIAGALRIPRGFLEFAADENLPYFNAKLSKDADIVLVCGAGGQAALAGKTLREMGYHNVSNVGGISEWIAAGGKSES
ncbi:MAG: rhodanese-like domain-containing protein [Proteobacteria bacterium]|nr:rhodanese-like domain-containing protein [Pseudomonadota bacterium]MDA0961013.1 rhodanese-like domain-containing protein [Pseudomonadota bacterium]MDA1152607.1 rhodanese-like domain-containing protein [Pseudomonadota bacterium]